MINLLKFELKKLFRTPDFYYMLILFGVVIIAKLIEYYGFADANIGLVTSSEAEALKKSSFKFMSNVNLSYILSVYGAFAGIYAIEEFKTNTITTIYSRGYSRTQVFLSKIPVLLIATTVYFVTNTLFSLGIGMIFFDNITANINYPLIMLLQYFAILIIVFDVFFVCTIIKNQYITVIFSVFYWVLGAIIVTDNNDNSAFTKLLTTICPLINASNGTSPKEIFISFLLAIIHLIAVFVASLMINAKTD